MVQRLLDRPGESARALGIGGLLGAIALCWILITPPGAGPDEPGHLVRAGAVARGNLDGVEVGTLSLEAYDLPDSYVVPEPACYAFEPRTAVDCAAVPERSGATVSLASRADEYPVWGHLTYGLASRLPGLAPLWWARLAGAAIAVSLLTASIAVGRDRRPLLAAGVIAATTPMAWSTFALVNPSAFGIAGATALWVGLSDESPRRATSWLLAAGWVALALPRRDGLIWACLILAVFLLAHGRSFGAWWRDIGRGPQVLIVASTLATIAWGLTNDSRVSRMVALSPLVIVAAEAGRRTWQRTATGRGRRFGLLAGATGVGALLLAAVVRARPGGWNTELARAIVGQTGNHVVEAIGVLGWLDTHLPALVIVGWVAVVGALAAAALTESARLPLIAGGVLTIAILTSWVFELYQGNTTGRYWQGRYSLPLLAGIPILLSTAPVPAPVARRLAWIAGGGALLLVNVAAWSAARRWGVGIEGSLAPWRWDTVHHPLPPVIVLAVHAGCSACLARLVFGPVPVAAAQPQRLTPSASTT